MKWYLKVLNHYADFSGRARRTEYWMFLLFNMIFAIVAMLLDNILGLTLGQLPYGVFYLLYVLAVFIPGIAVVVRRLHDAGQSGWMILIGLIPLIGAVWLFILMLTDSEPGENKYGPNPKENLAENQDIESLDGNFPIEKEKGAGDTVIILCVVWMLLTRFIFSVVPKFIDDFYKIYSADWFQYVDILVSLIWSLIPLALAFAVKNKSSKTILFIFGGLYFLYGAYQTIYNFIEY